MINRRNQAEGRKSPQRPQQPYYSQRPLENNNRTSQNLKGKPLISPRNMNVHPASNNLPSTRTCINHPAKRAEFMAAEEGNC